MKVFLKNKLPAGLWSFLKQAGHFILWLRDRFIVILASSLIAVLRVLSKQLLVAIKERLSIIVRMDYEPHDIYLNADSVTEYITRRNSSKKEPETITWIETYVRPGDVFYDVGANVGAYSFVADRHTSGKVKVYAFEPSFSTFAQLNRNIFLNSCQGRIIPFCIALSSKTDILVLNYSSLTPGAALHALGQPLDNLRQTFKPAFEQPVLSYRIDDLIKAFEIEKPTHIKLDVDGIELEILKGAEETLRDPALKSILVEIEPSLEMSTQVVEYLKTRGFRIQMVRSHGRSEMATSNYLFVRTGK